jgi:peptide/nickel transport system permease protein
MRFIEVFKTIPALILLLALIAIISKPSILTLILTLAFLLWPTVARFSRAEMLRIREEDYINSAKILGLSDIKIILTHALPNALGPIMVVIAFGISGAILLEATLSFLGLGLALDDVSWGSMLSEARQNFKAWWLALFPGIAIFFTVASFNIIGDRIQSILKSK